MKDLPSRLSADLEFIARLLGAKAGHGPATISGSDFPKRRDLPFHATSDLRLVSGFPYIDICSNHYVFRSAGVTSWWPGRKN